MLQGIAVNHDDRRITSTLVSIAKLRTEHPMARGLLFFDGSKQHPRQAGCNNLAIAAAKAPSTERSRPAIPCALSAET